VAEVVEIHFLAKLWYDGWQDAHARILPGELARYRTLEVCRYENDLRQRRQARHVGFMSSNHRLRLSLVAVTVGLLGPIATSAPMARQIPPDVLQALAPTGRLRVGVYPGSPTSMLRGSVPGDEKGLTVDIGRELGRRLGVPAVLVELPQIANVLEALQSGQVDMTVTNASAARAKLVDFSPPLIGAELGYLVAAGSSIAGPEEVDRAGVDVGVTAGGSSHATLARELKLASVVPAQTLQAAVAMIRAGELDVYATNKAILFEMADQLPGARILDGRWGLEVFAVAIPKNRAPGLEFVRRFAEQVKTEGFVKRAAERAGMRGIVDATEIPRPRH
jgi:polar amino acid transport system substrate-binding protein